MCCFVWKPVPFGSGLSGLSFFSFNSQELHVEVELTMNPNWVSMVNAAWFGAYGHGEGGHLLGYPAEIDWNQIEADFQKCRERGFLGAVVDSS
jgi:hypothetical protein